MQKELLDKKASKIQEELARWAEEKKVLHPGERIVFTLQIEKIDTVRREDYWDMLPIQFFSKERLVAFGVEPQRATRISNIIRDLMERERKATMREFLARYDTRREFLRLKDMGPKAAQAVADVLKQANLADI
jgi:hypothetical protein